MRRRVLIAEREDSSLVDRFFSMIEMRQSALPEMKEEGKSSSFFRMVSQAEGHITAGEREREREMKEEKEGYRIERK